MDLNQEIAQATLYQRSYEASVRLQSIIDDMLNVLINHMGSPIPWAGHQLWLSLGPWEAACGVSCCFSRSWCPRAP